jgi:hypothetical protein
MVLQKVPVHFSSQTACHFLRMALELGAARCLREPFAPASLLMLINECLGNDQSRFANAIQAR